MFSTQLLLTVSIIGPNIYREIVIISYPSVKPCLIGAEKNRLYG